MQERFWSEHTRIKIALVVTAKFHSGFVDMRGNLYMCGHGLGGRLGLGAKEGVHTHATSARVSSHRLLTRLWLM